MRMKYSKNLTLSFFAAFLLLSLILAVMVGPTYIEVAVIIRILGSKIPFLSSELLTVEGPAEVIIILIRLPRAFQGALVGASLATAGVVIQSLFRNPMADPFVIGISSGGALGAATAILLGFGGIFTLPIMAFFGATAAAFTVYRISKSEGGVVVETLLLSGIAVAYFFSSMTSFLLYRAGEALHQIIFWLMGGLWSSSWTNVGIMFPVFILSFGGLLFLARDLNALLLGEEPAHHLGIEVEALKKIILIGASVLAGVSVAFSGTIGFVGLIIPHISRILVGPDHRVLLPASALIGGSFLVVSDTLARVILAPGEIPVGVITAFFGAPFFMHLLRGRSKKL